VVPGVLFSSQGLKDFPNPSFRDIPQWWSVNTWTILASPHPRFPVVKARKPSKKGSKGLGIFKRFRREQPSVITIVSGLPRSGTSMMMKVLQAGGLEVFTDNLRVADEDNPKGYYELEQVKALKDGNDS